MSWFYDFSKIVLMMAVFLLTRWRVRGADNVPQQGPLLVVSNHLNNTDPPLVGLSLRRRVRFMAKEQLFRSRLGDLFIRSLGAFPVHRGRLDRDALRQAEQILTDGQVLVMFPEGTRSKNAQLQPALPGAALIACRCNVAILPVAVAGTEKINGASWWLRRPEITINIGSSFRLPPIDGQPSKAELEKQTTFIMEHIAGLLPAEYRGHYQPRGG
ncbi:MAG: lysophospholipid acyltransferase family protein [Chloroflexota bacterium]